ncbi:uncharacterized protein HGUI_01428 [Hanseniaspora guilliermondii]|uniref:Uncharacterized protein n=1 Tax=Hanseniaspora guilliermondii TaxID=56406 RepID=A0A1L0B0A8_9ASCO|nr:uncharacterized protein HGUI_01428 [Hanseniaspora guilliermondii]
MAIKINIKSKGKKVASANTNNKKNNNLFNDKSKKKKEEKVMPEKVMITTYKNDFIDNDSNEKALKVNTDSKTKILNIIKDVKPVNKEDLPKEKQNGDHIEDSMKKSIGILKMIGFTDNDIYESFA